MSKFKVTLRRNGKSVGEMSYSSEAVAVTRAKAMKEATGCAVSVAPAKAKPRRAAKPRRNGHLCNPGCGCSTNPRRNGASEFAFDDHFQRIFINEGNGWVKAPHHKGGSPAAYLRQIEALVADGSMSTGTAARLRKQMKDAGFVPQSNPRRRNGTPSANLAASTSLVHRAGLRRNAAIEIG